MANVRSSRDRMAELVKDRADEQSQEEVRHLFPGYVQTGNLQMDEFREVSAKCSDERSVGSDGHHVDKRWSLTDRSIDPSTSVRRSILGWSKWKVALRIVGVAVRRYI